jgi:hypothetical protein
MENFIDEHKKLTKLSLKFSTTVNTNSYVSDVILFCEKLLKQIRKLLKQIRKLLYFIEDNKNEFEEESYEILHEQYTNSIVIYNRIMISLMSVD